MKKENTSLALYIPVNTYWKSLKQRDGNDDDDDDDDGDEWAENGESALECCF